MNRIRFGIVLLFLIVDHRSSIVTAAIGSFTQIGNGAQIEDGAVIGSFSQINNGAVIVKSAQVGSFTQIGGNTKIGKNTIIGDHVVIGPDTQVSNNVFLSNFAQLGRNVTIQHNSRVGAHAGIGRDTYVGSDCFVIQHAHLGKNVRMENNAIADQFASIGDHAVIQKSAYVGNFVNIGRNVNVGQSAVIHEFTRVQDGDTIAERQVAIASPSTQILFSILNENPIQCNANDTQSQVSDNDDSGFNSSIMNLMTQQWTELIRYCESPTNSNPIRMSGLSCIVRQYLLGYYGPERLNQLLEPHRYTFAEQKEISDTFHFEPNAAKTILSEEATKEFVRLLAVQKDIRREQRTIGDQQCQMIGEIRQQSRDVVVKVSRSQINAPTMSFGPQINNNNVRIQF